MGLADVNPRKRPLAVRLRSKVAHRDADEPIGALLIEAAEAIEHLAARVAELEYGLSASNPSYRPKT